MNRASSLAMDVRNLTKRYKLYNNPKDRLIEALTPWHSKRHHDFFALQRVAFSVKQGETLGIIGKNGSGKSTLLKIITGVLTPTEGVAQVQGKVAALLELGAGFHPEYTGLENIYLNGTMMGFSRHEVTAKLRQIVSFADIGDFIHQPVRTYSSGMFVRLAFATAINVDPDILIVDEALSVGDMYFQLKCYHKFQEFREAGKTILFVTHDMSSILKYCDRAIVLNEGHMVADGTPREMVDIYKKILVNQYSGEGSNGTPNPSTAPAPTTTWRSSFPQNPNATPYGNGKANIVDYGVFDKHGKPSPNLEKGGSWSVRFRVEFLQAITSPIFAFTIKDRKGTELAGTNTLLEQHEIRDIEAGETVEVAFEQQMPLQGGDYFLSLGCTGFDAEGNLEVYCRLYDILQFSVISHKNTVGFFDLNSSVTLTRNLEVTTGQEV